MGDEPDEPLPQGYAAMAAPALLGVTPPTFDWDAGDLPREFRVFRRYCGLLLSQPPYSLRPGSETVNLILLWMGSRAVEIYDNWTHLSEGDMTSPLAVWDSFQAYFEPKSNFRLCRFMLREMRQSTTESIDSFVTCLRAQANQCNFASRALVEDGVLDQLIFGVRELSVRKRLLDCDPADLTLDKAVDKVRIHESTQRHLAQLQSVTAQVHSLATRRPPPKCGSRYSQSRRPDAVAPPSDFDTCCNNCGYHSHARRAECPAYGETCNRCGKPGHFAKVCRSSARAQTSSAPGAAHPRAPRPRKPRNSVNAVDLPDLSETSFHTATADPPADDNRTEVFATIRFRHHGTHLSNLTGKVDSGAQGNIMPLRTYREIFPDSVSHNGLPVGLPNSRVALTAYNGTHIKQYGSVSLPCQYAASQWHTATFYVADAKGPVIFGLSLCTKVGLLKLHCSINRSPTEHKPIQSLCSPTEHKPIQSLSELAHAYPDRFEGLGKFQFQHTLQLDPDVPPVRHAPRRAPVQLREQIRKELDRMVSLDVIRPVDEPTEWVSSITYVTKRDGSLRLCLDPKDVNRALRRGQHHTPTVDELSHKLSGSTVFSKLDAKSGYWSIPLSPDCQSITTFNSPFGRYCFKRLPFGLKSSQDVFQSAMDQILDRLPGVLSIADDIIVFGKNLDAHEKHLRGLMERARQHGLVFNAAKCTIGAPEVPFFGHIYSSAGIHPDPAKVQAICDMAEPTDVKSLRTFLGMVTYLSDHVPNLSDVTACLRLLLREDAEFQWHPEHAQAFQRMKKLICEANTLAYFDPTKPSVIEVDASQEALGAALTQGSQIIAFASKSLTDTEKRYANIEREMLACVFGAERFHTYVYGASFLIQSDHKPLSAIVKKSLSEAPPRLQRMLLRLQKYDCTIEYRPGKDMVLADSLSRIPTNVTHSEIPLDLHVAFVQFSTPRLVELRQETARDPILNQLSAYIAHGFPGTNREMQGDTKLFWSFRDEMSIEDGIILKGQRVVIPTSLRPFYLERIHQGHQGITRCQLLAKDAIYWPAMLRDIENTVSDCQQCQTHQPSQAHQPIMPVASELPRVPWHTLSMDIFTLDSQDYLLIADYHTRYPLVEKLSDSSSSRAVATIVSKAISMFGVPTTIISDNGPQFIGRPFQDVITTFGISHITSSPHHPKSHGFIERMVRTVKGTLRKSAKECDLALLNLRTTPLGSQLPSPAELMFNRRIPASLPTYTDSAGRGSELLHMLRDTTRAPQGTKELMDLSVDQPIYYQDVAKKTWSPATIVGIGPEPRSYTIRCEATGRFLRRNRILIRPRRMSAADLNDPPRIEPRFPNTATPPNNGTIQQVPTQPQAPLAAHHPQPHAPRAPPHTPPYERIPPTRPSPAPVQYSRSGRAIRPPVRLIEETE